MGPKIKARVDTSVTSVCETAVGRKLRSFLQNMEKNPGLGEWAQDVGAFHPKKRDSSS